MLREWAGEETLAKIDQALTPPLGWVDPYDERGEVAESVPSWYRSDEAAEAEWEAEFRRGGPSAGP